MSPWSILQVGGGRRRQQSTHDRHVPARRSQHQRRITVACADCETRTGAREAIDHVRMAVRRGAGERRHAIAIGGFDRGAGLEQRGDDRSGAVAGGQPERGSTRVVHG